MEPGRHRGDDPARAPAALTRIINAWLGGNVNTSADRAAANELATWWPGVARAVNEERAFVLRAVNWAAWHGTVQFLDAAAWLPWGPTVRSIAGAVAPSSRVVAATGDLFVLTHARVTAGEPGLAAVYQTVSDPAGMLADPVLQQVISLRVPVCVILSHVLHLMPSVQAQTVVMGFMARLVPGSCVIVSVPVFDTRGHPDEVAGFRKVHEDVTGQPVYLHAERDVAAWLGGLEVDGEVADVRAWRAPHPVGRVAPRPVGRIIGAVARRERGGRRAV